MKARKRLDGLLAKLVDGDDLIVSEIDRLGRTTADVILMMDELTHRGVALKVMGMPSLDITSDDGRLIADIMASLAAHERRRTRRRQAEGIAAAKAAKRHLGRPREMNGQQIAEARARIEADEPARIVAKGLRRRREDTALQPSRFDQSMIGNQGLQIAGDMTHAPGANRFTFWRAMRREARAA